MSRSSTSKDRIATAWLPALWLGTLGLGSSALGAEALRPLPTFGTGVEVVNLTVSVTDLAHRYVGDLDARELVLFEDGKPQEITLFARETVPLSLTILVDGSSSMRSRLGVTRAATLRLIRALGPQDEAQVAQFDRRLRVLQEPTSDRAALERAVEAIRADGMTALHDALYVALKELQASREEEVRRRAVVVLSDGDDTGSLMSDDQVLDLARRTEVNVYPIGLQDSTFRLPSPPPDYFLTALARETGGQAFFPATLTDLEGVFERIAEELRTLYAVGYVSGNPSRDGHWRHLAVHTARKNLLVRHRLGYYAPTGSRGAFDLVTDAR
jgi:Ca-activated chloride channel family protein